MKWKIGRKNKYQQALLGFALTLSSVSFLISASTPTGKVRSISYDENGVVFQLFNTDGTTVNHDQGCGSNDTYSLNTSHTNYKAIVGALIASHTAERFVSISINGCNNTHAQIAGLDLGTQPSSASLNNVLFSGQVITGNGSFQEINSNINTTDNEAMVITKRLDADSDWSVYDTVRGATNYVRFNSVDATSVDSNGLTTFINSGHGVSGSALTNTSNGEYWHLTMQSKEGVFDVVKYTGNGSNQTIPHNLNTDVGLILLKNLSAENYWMMWHKDFSSGQYVNVSVDNSTPGNDLSIFSSLPTPNHFSIGGSANVNTSGNEYIAYLFAHNPDNQVYVGKYTGTGSAGNQQELGFKPKFLLLKEMTGNRGINILSSDVQGSDNVKKWLSFTSPSGAGSFSFATNFNNTGFNFEKSSGNWSGWELYYLAIGEPM